MATSTGTVTLRAKFANDDEALFPERVRQRQDPGRYAAASRARAHAGGAERRARRLCLSRQRRQHGVRAQGDARVRATARIPPSCPVSRSGDTVVIDGTDRLSDGAKISVAPARSRRRRRRDVAADAGSAPAIQGPKETCARAAQGAAPRLSDRSARRARHEHLPPVRIEAGRHLAADDRARAGGPGRRALPAGLLAARRRLSDHPGADLLSRREPSGDGDHRDRAARGAARRNSEPHADDLRELRGRLGHHPAVQSRAQSRHRRAECPASHQRRQQPAAGRTARAAGICQGQPGRSADPHPRGDVGVALAHAAAGHRQQSTRLEDLRGAGRRPRDSLGRQRAGGSRRGRPAEALRLRPQHR